MLLHFCWNSKLFAHIKTTLYCDNVFWLGPPKKSLKAADFSCVSPCVLVCRSWGRGSCGESTVSLSTCPQTVKTCWRNSSCSTRSNEAVWRYNTAVCRHCYSLLSVQKCFFLFCTAAEQTVLMIWSTIVVRHLKAHNCRCVVNYQPTEHFTVCQREIWKHYSSEIKEWSYIILWWERSEMIKQSGVCCKKCIKSTESFSLTVSKS